jgi:hypothetical protein
MAHAGLQAAVRQEDAYPAGAAAGAGAGASAPVRPRGGGGAVLLGALRRSGLHRAHRPGAPAAPLLERTVEALRWVGSTEPGLLLNNQVVVTFDARTTREWLLATLLSVLTTCTMDPIKVALVTVALARCKKCKKEKHNLRQVHHFIRL